MGSPPCKILKTILKKDPGGTQTNGPKSKKIDNFTQGITSERLYRQIVCAKKKNGGKSRLASFEYCVNASIQGLDDYIKKSKNRLITAANNNSGNISIDRKITRIRKKKWEEKELYGYFKQQIGKIVHNKMWTWLRKS